MISSSTQAEVCIICSQPQAKYRLLQKCATCHKRINRRCINMPTDSDVVYCTQCLPAEHLEGGAKRKSTVSGAGTQSRKNSVSIPQSRLSK